LGHLIGEVRIKDGNLRNLILKVKILEQEIGKKIYYQYVPREKNKISDRLVNSSF